MTRSPNGAGARQQDALVDYRASEHFVPEWRRREGANAAALVWNGLLCDKTIRVLWRAEPGGLLNAVNGAYESHCP